jgi:hypothetical protein
VGFAPSGSGGAASATNRSSGRSSTTTMACAHRAAGTTSATTTTDRTRRDRPVVGVSGVRIGGRTLRLTVASVIRLAESSFGRT